MPSIIKLVIFAAVYSAVLAGLHFYPSRRLNDLSGKSLRPHAVICWRCPAPSAKIFLFFRSANQAYDLPSRPTQRGDSRSSRTRGGLRWTRMALLTKAPEADGEGVWS
jgi:hypothetical protein